MVAWVVDDHHSVRFAEEDLLDRQSIRAQLLPLNDILEGARKRSVEGFGTLGARFGAGNQVKEGEAHLKTRSFYDRNQDVRLQG